MLGGGSGFWFACQLRRTRGRSRDQLQIDYGEETALEAGEQYWQPYWHCCKPLGITKNRPLLGSAKNRLKTALDTV